MRGQGIRDARATKRWNHAHPRPTRYRGVPRIVLTAPLSSVTVDFHLSQCEKLPRYGKLVTSVCSVRR